ncbi:MAG: response regulator [Verrucomicrobiales bacterium]
MKILVLEDNDLFRRMLATHLERIAPGHRVLTAGTVKEALEISQDSSIRLFILDIHLPDGTGLDVLSQVRESHPQSCAVVMTSSPQAELREAAQRFGALHFLTKPIQLKRFTDLVHTLLENPGQNCAPLAQNDTQLIHMSWLEALHIQCLTLSNAGLKFTCPSPDCSAEEVLVFFQDGSIVHAKSSQHEGLDALLEIAEWPAHQFQSQLAEAPKKTITTPWLALRERLQKQHQDTVAQRGEANPRRDPAPKEP